MSSQQESDPTLISLVLTGRGDIVSAESNGKKMSTVEDSGEDGSDNQAPEQPDQGRDRWEMSVTFGKDKDDFRVSWSSSLSRSMSFRVRRSSEDAGQGPQDTDRDRWELNFDIGPAQLDGAWEEPSLHALRAADNGSGHPDHAGSAEANSP